MLVADDIEGLCRIDESWLRSDMAKSTSSNPGIRVALIPDAATMQWHHAREEFLAQELYGRWPLSKGALAKTADGRRTWCIWSRTFNEDVLNILRLVVEGENPSGRQPVDAAINGDQDNSDRAMVAAVAAVLQAAQCEASDWGMASVQFWNPSRLTVVAAKVVDPSAEVVDREDESLTSLRWHGQAPSSGIDIDWISNEKYAWC